MTQLLTKRIPISESRWKQLGNIKQAGQTYDDLLGDMLQAYNRRQLSQEAKNALIGKGNWHKLEDV